MKKKIIILSALLIIIGIFAAVCISKMVEKKNFINKCMVETSNEGFCECAFRIYKERENGVEELDVTPCMGELFGKKFIADSVSVAAEDMPELLKDVQEVLEKHKKK